MVYASPYEITMLHFSRPCGHLWVGHHLQAFSLTPQLTVCFARGISLQGLDILLHFLQNTTHHYPPLHWLQVSIVYIDPTPSLGEEFHP